MGVAGPEVSKAVHLSGGAGHWCAAVAGGEYKPVAIRPAGTARMVFQKTSPEDVGKRRSPHRQSGMAGICLLHGVHGETSDSVNAKLIELGLVESSL